MSKILIRIKNWWPNSGVDLVVSLLPLQLEASECCLPSLGGPRLLFWANDSHWPPSGDTKIRIRVKIQLSNSGVDLVASLYDSHSCANGCLISSFKALGDPKTCHSELRVLYCICGTESSWPKASRYHCIPYVMGGGLELFIHIRVVTVPAANRITLPYFTLLNLPYLLTRPKRTTVN